MLNAKISTLLLTAVAAFTALSCHELKKPGDLSGKSLFGTNIGQGRYFLLTFDADPTKCTLSKYVDVVPYAERGGRVDTVGKKIFAVPGTCNRTDECHYVLGFEDQGQGSLSATMYYYEGVYYFRMGAEAYPMPEP